MAIVDKFEVTIVSSKGQVVIPAAFRKMLGIRPGTKLAVLSDGRNLLLKPFALPPSLAAFRRLIKKSAAKKRQQTYAMPHFPPVTAK